MSVTVLEAEREAIAPARTRAWRDAAWLVFIMIVAAVLRGLTLDTGLWQDEIGALVGTMRAPLSQLVTTYYADTHHPLYSILAHLSITALGESPWTVRLPAVLFGVATVPALYALARRVGSRREAILAAILLSVSYHHVWFSQNARGYSALAFFATLCGYFLVRGMQEQKARWFALYAVFVALGAYTHLTIIFMAIAHAALCAWITLGPQSQRRLRDWRLPLLAFGGGAVLTVLLYLPMIEDVLWWYLYRPSRLLGVSTPSWALVEGVRMLALGLGVHPIVLTGAATIFAVGVVSLWRQDSAVAIAFLLPAFATLAGAFLARGTMYPRFFFFLASFFILIAIRGAVVTGAWLGARTLPMRWHYRREIIGFILVALMIIGSARSLGYNYSYPKQDFAGAISYVEAERSGREPIVVAGARYPYTDYYLRPWPAVESAAGFEELRRGGQPVWVLYMQPRYIEIGAPGLVVAIEEACASRRQFDGTVGGGDIIVCRVDPLPAATTP